MIYVAYTSLDITISVEDGSKGWRAKICVNNRATIVSDEGMRR